MPRGLIGDANNVIAPIKHTCVVMTTYPMSMGFCILWGVTYITLALSRQKKLRHVARDEGVQAQMKNYRHHYLYPGLALVVCSLILPPLLGDDFWYIAFAIPLAIAFVSIVRLTFIATSGKSRKFWVGVASLLSLVFWINFTLGEYLTDNMPKDPACGPHGRDWVPPIWGERSSGK